MSRKINDRILIGIGFCIFLFVFGYFILNYIKTIQNPPFGDTIYILIGCAFMFSSVLGVALILKYSYDYKKKKDRRERKRKKHKLFFLKDIDKKKEPN